MAGKGKLISVTVDDDVLANLDELADDLGISRSATVNMLLKASVSQDMGGMFKDMFKAAMSKQTKKQQKRKAATAQ